MPVMAADLLDRKVSGSLWVRALLWGAGAEGSVPAPDTLAQTVTWQVGPL